MPALRETPPHRRRVSAGEVARTPEVSLTHRADSAVEYLVAWLKANPDAAHPARLSGALCLAVEEAAMLRGWGGLDGEGRQPG